MYATVIVYKGSDGFPLHKGFFVSDTPAVISFGPDEAMSDFQARYAYPMWDRGEAEEEAEDSYTIAPRPLLLILAISDAVHARPAKCYER